MGFTLPMTGYTDYNTADPIRLPIPYEHSGLIEQHGSPFFERNYLGWTICYRIWIISYRFQAGQRPTFDLLVSRRSLLNWLTYNSTSAYPMLQAALTSEVFILKTYILMKVKTLKQTLL
jgi:hypothetical protein